MRTLALALALLGLLLVPAGASAHAVLVGTVPERGAVLDAGPRQLELRFDEPVEAAFGAVQVLDAQGERVDDGVDLRGTTLVTKLRGELPDGTYVASFRVVSGDGHPVRGGLVFSVGEAGAPAASVAELTAGGDTGPVTGVAAGVTRGVGYGAIALVLGGLLFLLLCWRPAAHHLPAPARAAFTDRAGRLLGAGLAVGVVGALAGLVLQTAVAAGTSAWAALDPALLADGAGTRTGQSWVARGVAFALLVPVLLLLRTRGRYPALAGAAATETTERRQLSTSAVGSTRRSGRWVWWSAVPPATVLAVAPGLGGHAGVTSPAALMTALNTVHVLAMSAWVGGIALLLLAVPAATRALPVEHRGRLLSDVLGRFSPLALGCVAALLATGVAQEVVHLTAVADLWQSAFGRALLAKSVLLLGLIGLGALQRRRVLPGLRSATTPGAAGRLLRRALRAELALFAVVLGVTAALTGTPPPGAEAAGPFSASARSGPALMELTLEPAAAGPNELHLYLVQPDTGAPFTGTQELRITAELPDRDIGPLDVTLREAGPGHWVSDGLVLAPAGDWRLRTTNRTSDFDQFDTTTEVPIP